MDARYKSLFRQLAVPMLLVGLMSLAVTTYISLQLRESIKNISGFAVTSQTMIQRLQDMDKLLIEYRAIALKHLAAENAGVMQQQRGLLELYRRDVTEIGHHLVIEHQEHEDVLDDVNKLNGELAHYFTRMTEVLALSGDFEKEAAFDSFRVIERDLYPPLQNTLASLRNHAMASIEASRTALLIEARDNQIMALVLGVGGGVAVILVAFQFTRRLTRRLQNILHWSDQFAHGGDSAVLVDRRADELGDVATAINSMAVRIDEAMNELKQAKLDAEQHASDLRVAESSLRNLNEELEERVRERTTEMTRAKDEAEKANMAKSEFLSRMSHELRTPMNAIMGFAQLLEIDETLNADQKDSVDEIRKASKHLLELINEVLDLSKIESGKVDISVEPLEIKPLLREICTLVEPMAQQRNITLLGEVNDCQLLGDRTRLKQVLLNLTSNAIKYNRDGGIVRIDTLPGENERVRISITDTGDGIPEDQQSELFQPFNRLDAEQSAIEGTGIGLVISKRLIELMHGSIGMCSTPGEGSTFWIELPKIVATEFSPHTKTSIAVADTGLSVTAPPGAHSVLYIDDNPANLRLVQQVLARYPQVELITAQNAWEGVDMAIAKRPRMILLDINMPEMNGYEVLSVLRGHECCRGTPIIAFSAAAMDKDIARGLAAGFDDYLTKPLDIKHLMTLVEQLELPTVAK